MRQLLSVENMNVVVCLQKISLVIRWRWKGYESWTMLFDSYWGKEECWKSASFNTTTHAPVQSYTQTSGGHTLRFLVSPRAIYTQQLIILLILSTQKILMCTPKILNPYGPIIKENFVTKLEITQILVKHIFLNLFGANASATFHLFFIIFGIMFLSFTLVKRLE